MKRVVSSLIETLLWLVLLTGALYWAYMLGDVPGKMSLELLLIGSVPIFVCWGIFLLIHFKSKPLWWEAAPIVLATVAFFPLLWQPWHPGTLFLEKLDSIEVGMSEKDAQQIMVGYLGGAKGETSDMYLPQELRGKGVTHCLYYRWTSTDSRHNADVAHIYLRDGTVIGTFFSPD